MEVSESCTTRGLTQVIPPKHVNSSEFPQSEPSDFSSDTRPFPLLDSDDVHTSLSISGSMLNRSSADAWIWSNLTTEVKETGLGLGIREQSNLAPLSGAASFSGVSSPEQVSPSQAPEGKVNPEDVEKVIQFHLKKLNDYYDCEKLFIADRYHSYLMKVFEFCSQYFKTYSARVNVLKFQTFSAGGGCLTEDSCQKIIKLLEEALSSIKIGCDTIESATRGAGEISQHEISKIKVKMAFAAMSSFHLEHLKLGCAPNCVPVARFPDSVSRHSLSTVQSISFVDQSVDATLLFGKTASLRQTPNNNFDGVDSPSNPVPVLVPLATEAAEAALGISGKTPLTSNGILQLLLKGDECFSHLCKPNDETELESVAESQGPNAGNEEPHVPETAAPTNKKSRLAKAKKTMSITGKSKGRFGASFRSKHSTVGRKVSAMVRNPFLYTHHQKCHPPSDIDTWSREKSKWLDIWYRAEKDLSISVKVRGKLPCALFKVLAVLNETDLATNWAPMMKAGTKEAQMSRTSQLVKQTYEYPLLGLKESITYVFGIDALSECGCVMIFCQPPPDKCENYLGYAVPKKGKVSRTQAANLCFLLFPISAGKQTSLEFYANFVHGLRYAPSKMIAYIVKKVIKDMFVSIARLAQHFPDSEYCQRVKANPEFYNWIQDVISEFVNTYNHAEEYTRQMIKELDTVSLASFNIDDFNQD